MPRDNDIPWCDVCERREATSVDDGIYRCEQCESARLAHLAECDGPSDDDDPGAELDTEALNYEDID